MTYPLGWQSWSPPHGGFSFLARDYCPLPITSHPRSTAFSKAITYWCSWYALGPVISPSSILHQAHLIKKYHLNIEYIIIDDGWRFGSSTIDLIQELHLLKLKVGLWYAPFTKHKNLPLYETLEHLVKNYHPDLLKLDFLYKPYFNSGLTDDRIPHQTLLDLFTYLRHNYPSLYTIACGCPFAPALGRVHAIRYSKDTTFPPPTPRWIRQLIYYSRVKLLSRKHSLIPPSFTSTPDPDVRMFSLDNATTANFWDTIHSECLGLGDNIDSLTTSQLDKARIWLQKNPSSPSSSPRLTRPNTSHYS
ncbi:MAG: hypothetical protein V1487_03760 [bacterium]